MFDAVVTDTPRFNLAFFNRVFDAAISVSRLRHIHFAKVNRTLSKNLILLFCLHMESGVRTSRYNLVHMI